MQVRMPKEHVCAKVGGEHAVSGSGGWGGVCSGQLGKQRVKGAWGCHVTLWDAPCFGLFSALCKMVNGKGLEEGREETPQMITEPRSLALPPQGNGLAIRIMEGSVGGRGMGIVGWSVWARWWCHLVSVREVGAAGAGRRNYPSLLPYWPLVLPEFSLGLIARTPGFYARLWEGSGV